MAVSCFFLTDLIGYQVPALLLLMAVSLMAMVFDIWPVLIIATLSALVWNFFFIPPIFTFHVGTTSDALMLLMYFLVASINTVLMSRIRRAERIARDKIEKQNEIKLYNTLFNSLSHELKTPISTILVASDTLSQEHSKLSDSARLELTAEIEKAGLRLQTQVENLLNMSRLESGMIRLQKDWADLGELTNRVVQKLQPEFQNRPVKIELEDHLPMYKLDGGLIEIVIENILRNAMIYSPKETEITIRITGKKEACEITLSDNGPGFPKNEIQFVFEKFHRFSNSKTGGTGLGLSIAKGFVEAHGGTIVPENKPTGGARFTIHIPAESTSLTIFNS
ncbi:MAG: PAS domain-containing sensor histidine kinase [Bacteroidetes bacterium]|nr:PAS domain-containing sensor histidine kinase [Bacteroidota bacterium]